MDLSHLFCRRDSYPLVDGGSFPAYLEVTLQFSPPTAYNSHNVSGAVRNRTHKRLRVSSFNNFNSCRPFSHSPRTLSSATLTCCAATSVPTPIFSQSRTWPTPLRPTALEDPPKPPSPPSSDGSNSRNTNTRSPFHCTCLLQQRNSSSVRHHLLPPVVVLVLAMSTHHPSSPSSQPDSADGIVANRCRPLRPDIYAGRRCVDVSTQPCHDYVQTDMVLCAWGDC